MVKTGPQFSSSQTLNPLEVVADTRLPAAGLGMMAAYMGRKWAYSTHRNVFGYAVRGTDGRVRFAPVDGRGVPIHGATLPGAQTNRLLYNLVTVGLGALVIGQSRDANIDYAALGVAAGGLANTVMSLLNIE